MAKGSESTSLEGVIERIVFHNPNSGWTVLRVQTVNSPLLETVVGRFQRLSPGEQVRFSGHYTMDAKHGRQFAAETCLPLAPATLKGIEKFLGSGLIPGIGPVMAGRLTREFGNETLTVIEEKPEKLARVEGIGPKRARAIRAALIEKKEIQDVMVFLESVGISPAFAHRVFKQFGKDAIRQVSTNPFRLAQKVSGIGFASADRIARHLGIAKDSPHRAEAGLLHALEELAAEGHVFATQSQLIERAAALTDIDFSLLERAVERLVLMGELRREQKKSDAPVYLPRLYRAEIAAAAMLKKILEQEPKPLPFDGAEAVRRATAESGIEFAPEQQRAFFVLSQAKVTVLTGGPGTGKTTLLRGLTSTLARAGLTIQLAAPTGRAARRMSEATGREARTVHRLLEFNPKTMGFDRNTTRPLDADIVVVDEVSMVDLELFAALLEAVRPSTRLLLVGDPNQLPSVGAGTVLSDLIRMDRITDSRFSLVALTQIFRQARSSLIITGAHDVLAGREPRVGDRGSGADLFLVEREDPEECVELIKELSLTRIPKRFSLNPVEDVQVLTPMHKGILGASNLNRELQELLNPGGATSMLKGRFRVGDKVMQVRNNYEMEVFNGDIGRVSGVLEEDSGLAVDFPDRTVRYPMSDLDQLTLAYACSVHKSQGSEYPAVIIPLHTQHFVMLERNLLYTAITRGKRLVVIVGSRRALRIAVQNAGQKTRASGLFDRVNTLIQ